MKLYTLKIKNFKGVADYTLNANGENTRILGDNETGKTTIMDAFLWCLTGKDSQGQSVFEIKPLNADGSARHNLDTEVQVELEKDGQRIILKKVFKEKWTKKRGTATKEFSGHTTDYYIDDVPVKKSEFDDRLSTLIENYEAFQLLINPMAFNRLPWEQRRNLVVQVAGVDTSDAAIIGSDPSLFDLAEIVSKATMDDHKKKVVARRKAINERLTEIPARIDELSNLMFPKANIEDLRHELASIQQEKICFSEDKKQLQAANPDTAKDTQIAELKNKRENIVLAYREQINKDLEPVAKELAEKKAAVNAADADRMEKENLAKRKSNEFAAIENKLALLRDEWREIDGRQIGDPPPDTCPTCKQSLPADQVEDARKKAELIFNEKKANDLKANTATGQKLATEKAGLKDEIANANEISAAHALNATSLASKVKALETQHGDIANRKLPKEWELCNQEILDLEDMVKAEVVDTSELDEKISGCDEKETELRKAIAEQESGEKTRTRITDLTKEEKDLSAEFERLEAELKLIDDFTIAKVRLIESKVAEKFKLARFKMFDVQINGGINEVCETTYLGVPWGSMNNAARINCGLDIITALGGHYGFTPPIFIDNAESVCQIIDTEAQQTRLYVDEDSKELTVVE